MELFAPHHATAGLQQRGIPAHVIDSLINYGKVNQDHRVLKDFYLYYHQKMNY